MGTRTRTNWFLDDLDLPDDDPFARVVTDGTQLDLTDDLETIHARIRETLDREGDLYKRSIVCPIKDDPSASCTVCPVRHADGDDPMTLLCELGLEQERLLTRVACARAGVL